MLKKLKLAAIALLLPLIAFAQSYPSPTFNNVTVQGTLSVTGAPAFTVPVPVASGGTGKTSVTANTLLYGAGTAALNTLGPLTNGQLVVGSTGAPPVAATLTGTANQVNVTNGAGTITLSTPQSIDSTASPTFAGLTLSTTPLGVASGGTGRATLTSHAVLVGAGTTAVTQLAVGTTGQVLVGSTGADPAFGSTVGALTFTGAITPSTTAGIVGTTAADNANAGSIGEFVSSAVQPSSAISMTTGTAANVTSISLTAGDWDVTGSVGFLPAGGTTSTFQSGWLSTTSATFPTSSVNNGALAQFAGLTGAAGTASNLFSVGSLRLSLSSTTTVYLSVQSNFSGSTQTAYGFISARRRR